MTGKRKFGDFYKQYKAGGKMVNSDTTNFLDIASGFADGGKMPMYADGGMMGLSGGGDDDKKKKQEQERAKAKEAFMREEAARRAEMERSAYQYHMSQPDSNAYKQTYQQMGMKTYPSQPKRFFAGGTMADTEALEAEQIMKQQNYHTTSTPGMIKSYEEAMRKVGNKVKDQFDKPGKPNAYASEEESYKRGKKKIMTKKK